MVTFAKRLRPTRLKALAVLGVVVLCLIARFAGPFLGLYVLTLFVTATWLVRKEKVFKFAKRLYELFRPFGFKMLGVLGFIVLSQALNFTGPYIDGKLVDGLSKAQHDRSLPTLWLYALTIVSGLTWLVRMSLLQYLRDRYEIIHLDYALTQHLQKFTLQRLFGFSLSQHTSQNSNIKTSVIGRGENAANNLVQMFLYQLLPTVSEAVILVGVLLYWSPSLGVETFAGIFAYLVWGGKINAKFLPDMRAYEKLYDKDQKFRGEVIKNIDTVITFAQEDRALKECCESRIEADSFTADVWLRFVKLARYRNMIVPVMKCGILITGVTLVLASRHTLGEYMMLVSWASNALGSVSMMAHMHRQMMRQYSSIEHYFDMLDVEPDVKAVPNPVKPEKLKGDIEFRDVTFSYKQREVVNSSKTDEFEPVGTEETIPEATLVGVNFKIPAGQTVAIVGESGAGKSTLVSALLRSHDPDKGQVIIDGHDLRDLDLKRFRERVGVVKQHVWLFDHTLRYNVTYGLNGHGPSVTDEELMKVAEMSCLNRFLPKLENGFDTVIGERGVKLSGGECQRVGIARALIKDPDILIFDEATSSLDSENEALIRESFKKAAEGRTTIIIAHRFSTIRNAERVLVIDRGRVVGDGTHASLKETCEPYQRLLKNQILEA